MRQVLEEDAHVSGGAGAGRWPLMGAAFLAGFLLLDLLSGKSHIYLMPLWPLLAGLTALALHRLDGAEARRFVLFAAGFAAMSTSDSAGLVGLSRKRTFVSGRMLASHAERSVPSTSVEGTPVANASEMRAELDAADDDGDLALEEAYAADLDEETEAEAEELMDEMDDADEEGDDVVFRFGGGDVLRIENASLDEVEAAVAFL